ITQDINAGQPSPIVNAVSLDDFAELEGWSRVDVIKMDIEGSEERALRGMRNLSKRSSDLRLIMEFNPMAMDRAGVSREILRIQLRELGFRHSFVIERGMRSLEPDILPSARAVCNLLFTK